MCGIFGIIVREKSSIPGDKIVQCLRQLALSSESRGKDSSGVSFHHEKDNTLEVIKGDIPVSSLLKSKQFEAVVKRSVQSYQQGSTFSAFGHARLVTNGSQLQEENNQPVIKDGMLVIHNGIIVNGDELWRRHPELKREYRIDTEVLPALIRCRLNTGDGIIPACRKSFGELSGTFSIAATFTDRDLFVLATNTGSFYYCTDERNYFIFASEQSMLLRLTASPEFRAFQQTPSAIRQLAANTGMVIHRTRIELTPFSLIDGNGSVDQELCNIPFTVTKHLIDNPDSRSEVVIDPANYLKTREEDPFYKLLEFHHEAVARLKRCSACLLPETFPFIEYDEKGVCNYCKNYQKVNQPKPLEDLHRFLEPYRRKEGGPDCIIPYSGGRDSTYTLWFVKEKLGLNPIAFTYDWGMVTDLARRNAARACGKLGVENIIVAADIRQKRENIRKNILAWLKRPHLGMIPLFMAGDKYFFYFSNRVLSQTGLQLSIWGSNPLENTNFKSGFTGVRPQFIKKRIDELNIGNKLRLASFFLGQFVSNTDYFNSSLRDTLGSFSSRYLIKRHGYIQLFDYIRWEEEEINRVITEEFDWERSIDTSSTWRIGDGTAAFYNYIYFTVAGFSEFDTFRSNQIREGQLTREEGLRLVNSENRPRYENLRWYLEIVGLDFTSTIRRINAIPKLYRQ